MQLRKCFIACWFGDLPEYFNIWLKSCAHNSGFDFLLYTDTDIVEELPQNVHMFPLTLSEFEQRAKETLNIEVSIERAYRVCDFRPMYGEIFKEDLAFYDFWGYCDVDVVFGDLGKFITDELLFGIDAVFNGGHLSLLRNDKKINSLYKKEGAAFNYKTVVTKDAIFAFDEITGIQAIAMKNGIAAKYLIPYIETEIRFYQLRSRLDKNNPENQAFYWEEGHLFRVKLENSEVFYQEISYMHLQKRRLKVDSHIFNALNAFWIVPNGFVEKEYLGKPSELDIKRINPFEGYGVLKRQNIVYKLKKIVTILKRNPYQIYVRIVQARNGINRNQGTLEENLWTKY